MTTQEYPIRIKKVATESDMYLDMALAMLEAIQRCRQEKRNCVMIVPVGPTGQYPVLAELVNRLHISLKHVHFFNMDEYLTAPGVCISPEDPMSFHKRMETEFYSRVLPELAMPVENRHFPEPGREAAYDALIEELGGVELCLGGLGINGHIAFNEPPEPGVEMDAETFAALGTRQLAVSRETLAVNAFGYLRGDIRGMPKYCITIGMKQILASREVYISLSRDWQHGIFRRVCTEPIQAQIPATLLRHHPKVTFYAPEAILD